jgi:hypothetical protein
VTLLTAHDDRTKPNEGPAVDEATQATIQIDTGPAATVPWTAPLSHVFTVFGKVVFFTMKFLDAGLDWFSNGKVQDVTTWVPYSPMDFMSLLLVRGLFRSSVKRRARPHMPGTHLPVKWIRSSMWICYPVRPHSCSHFADASRPTLLGMKTTRESWTHPKLLILFDFWCPYISKYVRKNVAHEKLSSSIDTFQLTIYITNIFFILYVLWLLLTKINELRTWTLLLFFIFAFKIALKNSKFSNLRT